VIVIVLMLVLVPVLVVVILVGVLVLWGRCRFGRRGHRRPPTSEQPEERGADLADRMMML
jgi:uncharacterized membrane protein